jgi:hypothetical protein
MKAPDWAVPAGLHARIPAKGRRAKLRKSLFMVFGTKLSGGLDTKLRKELLEDVVASRRGLF